MMETDLDALDEPTPIVPLVWYHTKDRECPFNTPVLLFCVAPEDDDIFMAYGWRSKRSGGYVMFADDCALDTERNPVHVLSFLVVCLPDGEVIVLG
jgi:hypothetical protein